MNFDFSEEQKLLQQTARDYLEAHSPLAEVRAVLESGAPYSASLQKGAGEMGWLGAAVPEEYGGAGFGHLELALIAHEVGRALAPIPFAPTAYLAIEALVRAGTPEQKARWLPGLASGERIGTFAFAEGAGRLRARDTATRLAGGRLDGSKRPVPDGASADVAVVVARADDGVALALVDFEEAGVTRTPLATLDPTRPQARLDLAGVRAERLGEPGDGDRLLARLLDAAATLLAFEQIGGAERAFEITRDFCSSRYAFGRPIASFQALKHRMADVYVELELARSNAYYAAWALHAGSDELATAAPAARASACDAFELASREMIQMHGGVGYTWEYDCHLFYRRAKHLALTLGSADQWRERLIERLDQASA